MTRYFKDADYADLSKFSLYKVGELVFIKRGSRADPEPYRISKVLDDGQYQLSKDGVCDNKIYFEESLKYASDIGWKNDEAKAKKGPKVKRGPKVKKDPQDSVDNAVVIEGSPPMPVKEVELNTANDDSLPHDTVTHQNPWKADMPDLDKLDLRQAKLPDPDKVDLRQPEIPVVVKLDLQQADTPDLHGPESQQAVMPDSNEADADQPSHPMGPGQATSEITPLVSHTKDSKGRLGRVKVEDIAQERVENSLLEDEKATDLSDRREVAARQDDYNEMSHIPQTAFEDSAYGTASHGQSRGVEGILPTISDAVERQIDDSCTEYSNISMTEPRRDDYAGCLADDLYAVASKIECDPQSIQTLSGLLPELLQQFALRIGTEFPRKECREVMFYAHKHRKWVLTVDIKRIGKMFEQYCSDWNEVHEDIAPRSSETFFSLERVEDWLEQVDSDFPLPNDAYELDTEVLEDDAFDQVEKYKKLVSKTSAYKWLLANMARELAQTFQESHVLKYIRREISRHLPSILKISPRRPPDTMTVVFQMHWDPMAFISEQKLLGDPAVVLGQAITLTGSLNSTQAVPCFQYLNQAWPTSGTFIAGLIQKLVRVEIGQQVFVHLSDGNKVTAWRGLAVVYIKTCGTRPSIVEVGEQLAWLGSALRSSPYDGIAYCRPQVEDGPWKTEQYFELQRDSAQAEAKVLTISFSFDPDSRGAGRQLPGTCWYSLFRNPVVVSGFPILRRNPYHDGLELPLNMLAGLIGAKRAHVFNDMVFIKGYSAMLVPSKQSDGLLVWHVLHNADGSRISYLDNYLPPLQDVGFWSLQTSRHIVGWCSYANSHAGGPEANYTIGRSRKPSPGPGCVLEKVSINGGKFITAGLNFAVGIKDIPAHLPRKPYVQKLRWISSKSIVFWDVAEERGWLVKGTSALLHLLRASLKHYETDEFSTSLLSKFNDIQEPSPGSQGDYARNILVDEDNMKLPIYPEKNEVQLEDDESTIQDPCRAPKTKRKYYRVEDRVEELYETLEKLVDHQINATGQAGMKMKAHARRRLEGWDFKDLASDKDPIYPHVTTLPALGKGWVDFLRSIQAVTLFGSGFGNIITPSTDVACRYWRQVPKHRFYLAACVTDLLRIMETDGDHTENPMQICDGILWYTSNAAFDACKCVESLGGKHSDFVQTLWPSSLSWMLPRRDKLPLQKKGAVIFGHNRNFKWKWKDTGNPVEGDSDLELAPAEDDFHDSGIGISETLASAPSNQRLSSDGSYDTTPPQGSQIEVNGCPAASEHSPSGLARVHHPTASNASIKVDTQETETRGPKPISFRGRIKRALPFDSLSGPNKKSKEGNDEAKPI